MGFLSESRNQHQFYRFIGFIGCSKSPRDAGGNVVLGNNTFKHQAC